MTQERIASFVCHAVCPLGNASGGFNRGVVSVVHIDRHGCMVVAVSASAVFRQSMRSTAKPGHEDQKCNEKC